MSEENDPDERYKDNDRFKKEYGVPPGRQDISTKDFGDRYVPVKLDHLEGKGGLNEGVSLVRDRETGHRVIQKNFNPQNPILRRELLLLHVLKHPNIIKYINGFLDMSVWYHPTASIYMEYCSFKTAQDLLNKYHDRNQGRHEDQWDYIPEALIWHIFRSVASALQYLHFGIQPDDRRRPEELGPLVKAEDYTRQTWPIIIHRDIKPENILFKKVHPKWEPTTEHRKILRVLKVPKKTGRYIPSYPKVILCDFGLALQYHDPDWNQNRDWAGTLAWMPPESPSIYVQSDIWALGAVILALCRQLLHGVITPPPADWTGGDEAWSKHRDARKGVRDRGVGKHYSAELNEAVYACLRFNRSNRPLAFELLGIIEKGIAGAREKGYLKETQVLKRVWNGGEDRLRGGRRKRDIAATEKKEGSPVG